MMKKLYSILLKGSVLLMSLVPTTAMAWDFESGGIYYDVVSFTDFTCAVAQGPKDAYVGNIVIPATTVYNNRELKVVGINKSAFFQTKVESVTGGENVEYIGESAFQSCNAEVVSLGDKISIIGRKAFYECKKLQEYTCPKVLNKIETQAFGNSGLTQVILNDGLETIASYAFQDTPIGSVIIPNSVISIEDDVFVDCKKLEKVTLPNSIETINRSIFYRCTSLNSITIPASVKTIKQSAFGMSGLVELKGGECVKEIERYAFENCTSLTNVDLGVSLKTIGSDAFKGCQAIKLINSYAPVAPKMATAWEPKVYINSTLNIMEGTTPAYANTINWTEFWNVQDCIPNDLSMFSFQVTAISDSDNGKILINGEDRAKSFAIGNSNLTLTFIPDFGFKVRSVIVNNVDMIADVTDNTLTIKDVKEAIYATVSYEQILVPLTISTADTGSLTQSVNYGSQVSYTISPADGWILHSITFNGENVTRKVEGDTYLTPSITTPSTINVVFEKSEVGNVGMAATDNISISATNGVVTISGAEDQEMVNVFSLDGKLVMASTEKTFQLTTGTAYIIKVASHSFKVLM